MTENNIKKATQYIWSGEKTGLMQGAAMGIPQSRTRYSTGIETAEDLISDLNQALTAV